MTFWRVPVVWPGETVFILAGGLSLAGQGIGRLAGHPYRVVAVNRSCEIYPWADYGFVADGRMFEPPKHRAVREFRAAFERDWDWRGRMATIDANLRLDGLRLLKKLVTPGKKPRGGLLNSPGLARDSATVACEHTSLRGAMNLALHLTGAFDPENPRPRLVLLGADGGPTVTAGSDGREIRRDHHHGPHPWAQKPETWTKQYAELKSTAAPLADLGVEVLNASPGTKLDFWPVTTLDAVLEEA